MLLVVLQMRSKFKVMTRPQMVRKVGGIHQLPVIIAFVASLLNSKPTPLKWLTSRYMMVIEMNIIKNFTFPQHSQSIHRKGKETSICIAPSRNKPLRCSGMACVFQGITQFYLHTQHSSTNGMDHTCLCLPCQSWSSFTDPGGIEGWVDLGIYRLSQE